jgi:hypothetical protein
MRGQWLGPYESTPNGSITVNIDELPSCYEGTAYLHPVDTPTGPIPKSEVVFRTSDKRTEAFSFSTPFVFPLHPDTHERAQWDDIKHLFAPDAFVAKRVDVTGRVEGGKLHLEWKNAEGFGGRCSLPGSDAGTQSALEGETVSWEEFKKRATKLASEERFIFRGQSKPWRLQTAFHRHGRSDLRRFLDQDMPQLHKVLSARTRHFFDMKDPQERASFLSLAQHHGYPTPLLDWTHSPFVAAFFAFRNVGRREAQHTNSDARVRVHVFDLARWTANAQQVLRVTSPLLHLSFVDVLAIENERLIPQQAVALYSNVDDIEEYLQGRENNLGIVEPHLRALDIPVSERETVFNELRYMGITAGALFPGVDGACEELKERSFPLR